MPDFINELCREDRQLLRRALTRLAEEPTIIKVGIFYVNMNYVTSIAIGNVHDKDVAKIWQVGDDPENPQITYDLSEIAALRAWCERKDWHAYYPI